MQSAFEEFPQADGCGSSLLSLAEQDGMVPEENSGGAILDGSQAGVRLDPQDQRGAHETPSKEATSVAAKGGAAEIDSSSADHCVMATSIRGCSALPGIGNDFASEKGRQWRELWDAWQALKGMEPGIGIRAAAEVLGCGYVTLWRLENDYAKRGFEARTDECGRNSQWEYLTTKNAENTEKETEGTLNAARAFQTKLRELYLATVGASGGNVTKGRRTAKMATALAAMAEEPECPAELAAQLKRGKFPICLQRFLRSITPELENRLRGPKHFQLNGLTSRRDLTVRFGDGSRAEMPAGFKWVFDDMSANQPFYTVLTGANGIPRVLFSRQGLYALDHRSLRWLGKELVARPREAYRAEDILRFCRKLFEQYGKPDMIVFELSVWHSRKIRGFRITETDAVVEDEFERPEMPAEERQMLQQGLESIGVKIVWAHSAHGKIIEGCFNHLQDVLAIMARQFVNIGRHGGEFEIPAKRLRQVRAGSHQPGPLGFATMSELSDCVDRAFAHINGKQNSRGEVPDEVWVRDCGAAGSGDSALAARPLPKLEQNDYAVFLPEVRERTIDGGRVVCQVGGHTHDFRAPWMIELGSGYRVYIRFDPSEPTLGAAVYNRESGPTNAQGLKVGAFIGWAVWEMPAPAADVEGDVRSLERRSVEEFYGRGAFDNQNNLRKKQSKIVATAFSALPRPGQPAVKVASARDGEGNVVTVGRGEVISNQSPVVSNQPQRVGRTFARPSEEERKNRVNNFARLAAIARGDLIAEDLAVGQAKNANKEETTIN